MINKHMTSSCSCSLLREEVFADDGFTLLLGGEETGKTSLSFAACHEVAMNLGEHSLFVCHQRHFNECFPLPVLTSSHGTTSTDRIQDDAAKFFPGALKKITLIHPENSSHLLELLMRASFSSCPPRLLVLDDFSSLIDPSGSLNISSPFFLDKALRAFSHIVDLVKFFKESCDTINLCGSKRKLSKNIRVIITEGRLNELNEDHAYYSLLRRFCGNAIRVEKQPITTMSLPSSPVGSICLFVVYRRGKTDTGSKIGASKVEAKSRTRLGSAAVVEKKFGVKYLLLQLRK